MKKATFNREQFIKGLQIVLPFVNPKNTLPIVDNILLKKTKTNVSMTVTDLELTVIFTYSTVNGDEFELCMDGKDLLELLSKSPDASFDFVVKQDDNGVCLSVTISLLNGDVLFPVYQANEFPQLPEMIDEKIGIMPSQVIHGRKNTWSTFCGIDETRPIMSGVNVEVIEEPNGKFIYAVATNGNILFVEKIKTDNDIINLTLPKKIMLHLAGVTKNDDVMYHYTNTNIRFVKENVTIIGRLIDGNYPKWRNVVPVNKFYMEIDRVQMINTVSKAMIAANKTTFQIILSMQGKEVVMESQDFEATKGSKFTIPANIYGPNLKIGFSGKYIISCLNQFTSGMVRIEYSAHNRAVLIKGTEEKGVMCLCMPQMLSVDVKEEERIIREWEESNLEPVVAEVVEATTEVKPVAEESVEDQLVDQPEAIEEEVSEELVEDDDLPDPDEREI